MMPAVRYLLCLALWCMAACAPWRGRAGSTAQGPVRLDLLSVATGIAPGSSTTLLVRFRLDRDWHLYWKNPGDSGLPPTLTWMLPEGWSAGEAAWPVPTLLRSEEGASHVYEHELLLAVPLRAPAEAVLGSAARVVLRAEWLACREGCVPGEGVAALLLPVLATPRERPRARERLTRLRRQGSRPLAWAARARLESGDLVIDFAADSLPRRVRLLPEQGCWLDESGTADWSQIAGGVELRQPLLGWGESPPDTLRALLLDLDQPGRAWHLRLPLPPAGKPLLE